MAESDQKSSCADKMDTFHLYVRLRLSHRVAFSLISLSHFEHQPTKIFTDTITDANDGMALEEGQVISLMTVIAPVDSSAHLTAVNARFY
jgi:hypothetical protein